jgi:hypothetical protein
MKVFSRRRRVVIMDKRKTDSLAHFCAVQRNNFKLEDWLTWSDTDREALALVAKYLSMTSWYGHADELEEIARRNHFSGQSIGLHCESQAIKFDLSYFSAKVRMNVARCQQNLQCRPGNPAESIVAMDLTGETRIH